MAKTDFINQLQALGYTVRELANDFVSIDYEITVGKFIGQKIEMVLQVPESYPMNAPPGPHMKPHLLPITGGGGAHPYGGIHTSTLGAEWQYWSRPFKEWNQSSNKNAQTYLAHIRNLLATI